MQESSNTSVPITCVITKARSFAKTVESTRKVLQHLPHPPPPLPAPLISSSTSRLRASSPASSLAGGSASVSPPMRRASEEVYDRRVPPSTTPTAVPSVAGISTVAYLMRMSPMAASTSPGGGALPLGTYTRPLRMREPAAASAGTSSVDGCTHASPHHSALARRVEERPYAPGRRVGVGVGVRAGMRVRVRVRVNVRVEERPLRADARLGAVDGRRVEIDAAGGRVVVAGEFEARRGNVDLEPLGRVPDLRLVVVLALVLHPLVHLNRPT